MSIIDLTPFFIEAHSQASSWYLEKLKDILLSIIQAIPDAKIDWDRGCGEYWVTIKKNKQELGIIRVDTPLAFFIDEYSDCVANIMSVYQVKLIAVSGFSEPGFKLDINQVEQIMPGFWHAEAEAVNSENLSISDLWYATI